MKPFGAGSAVSHAHDTTATSTAPDQGRAVIPSQRNAMTIAAVSSSSGRKRLITSMVTSVEAEFRRAVRRRPAKPAEKARGASTVRRRGVPAGVIDVLRRQHALHDGLVHQCSKGTSAPVHGLPKVHCMLLGWGVIASQKSGAATD